MHPKYRIEFDNGEWLVLMHCRDGIDDIVASYVTKAEAQTEIRNLKAEDRAMEGAERHYQAQYAYACGYLD